MLIGTLAVVRSHQSIVRGCAQRFKGRARREATDDFRVVDGVVDFVDNVHGLRAGRKISSARTQDGVAVGYGPIRATL